MQLQLISKQQAETVLKDVYGESVGELQYHSWPQTFSNTAGPFYKGGFVGQAFTEFQMECWTDGKFALVFSKGSFVKFLECDEPFSVNWYLSQRGSW